MASARPAFRAFAAALFFVLAFWGLQYALRGYWEPDEPRFVYVAREMAASHSPFLPLRNGEIYGHKPPLMMWLVTAGEAAFGAPFGSRLPVLLGAALSLLAIYRIGQMLAGAREGALAALLTATSVQCWEIFGRGQIDALLTGLVLSSAASFLSLRGRVSSARALPPFLLAGLALVAKGPVGLILPALIVAAVRIPAGGGRLPALSPAQWAAGFSAALLVPALWLGAAALSGAPAAYFREILLSQNVSRAAGGYGHVRPFWYLPMAFPAGFLPWTPILPGAIAALRRKNPLLLRQCALWAGFVVAFFSIPVSKRTVYIATAYPAAALLVAAAAREIAGRRWFAVVGGAIAALPPLVALAGGAFFAFGPLDALPPQMRDPRLAAKLAGVLLAAGLCTGACALAFFLPRFRRLRPETLLATALSAFFFVGNLLYPVLDAVKEPAAFGPLAARISPPGGRVLLHRFDGEIVALGANRRGRRVESDDEMRRAMLEEGRGLAVFSGRDGENLADRFPGFVKDSGLVLSGRKRYTWVEFKAPASPPAPEMRGRP